MSEQLHRIRNIRHSVEAARVRNSLLFGIAVALSVQSASAVSAEQTNDPANNLQRKPVSQKALRGFHMDPAPVVEQPNDWNEWKILMQTWLSNRFLEYTKKSVDAEMLEFPEPEKFKCKISFWVSRDQGTCLPGIPVGMDPVVENRKLNNHIRMFFLSFPKTLTRFPKDGNEDWVKCSVTLVGNQGATEFSATPTTIPPRFPNRKMIIVQPASSSSSPPEIITPGALDP